MKYVVEVNREQFVFDNQYAAKAYAAKCIWMQPGVDLQVYPLEPEEHEHPGFPGMCEGCGQEPACKGDFLCEQCLSSMALSYENEMLGWILWRIPKHPGQHGKYGFEYAVAREDVEAPYGATAERIKWFATEDEAADAADFLAKANRW